MTFTIPGRLPGYNELTKGHWAKRYRTKDAAMTLVGWCIRGARLSPITSPVAVAIRCYEPDKRRDYDNVTAGASKVILDALQNCGILKGDGQKYVTRVEPSVEIDRKNPRIEVEILEAP